MVLIIVILYYGYGHRYMQGMTAAMCASVQKKGRAEV